MKQMRFSIELLEYMGWDKQPSTTQYEDGHIEGTIVSPTGTTYAYDERQEITLYISDREP